MKRIWLLKDGEVLPLGGNRHRMRTGMLAEALVRQGADVTWWHGTFDHFSKTFHVPGAKDVEIGPHSRIRFLSAGRYDKNISLGRWRHHRRLAREFLARAEDCAAPSAIVCSYPIPELAEAALDYGRDHGVPVVIDVRDLWPDIFTHKSPVPLRPLVRLLTIPMRKRARRVMSGAQALVAVSEGYLQWALARAGRPASPQRDLMLPIGFQHLSEDPEPDPYLAEIMAPHQHKKIVVFVGSFSFSYDLETVARAAVEIWNSGRQDIVFLLAGDGRQRVTLERYAGKVGNIFLPGWLNRGQMDELLRQSDLGLVCCHSVPGTMPNKVSQYLAFGLPILSSLEGESEVLIRDHHLGGSYRVGDVSTLKNKIIEFCDDEDQLNRCRENSHRVFNEIFEAGNIYEEYARMVLKLGTVGIGKP